MPVSDVPDEGAAREGAPAGADTALRRSGWVNLGVWVLLAACLLGAFAFASGYRSYVQEHARQDFVATATDKGAVVASLLQRNVDFMATLQATVGTRPGLGNAEFTAWIRSVAVERRYPGGVGYSFIQRVPAADLAGFKRRMRADAAYPSAGSSVFTMMPPGERPYYCLTRLIANQQTGINFLGLDYCAIDRIPGVVIDTKSDVLQTIGDSGAYATARFDAGSERFVIVAPVYAGGRTPVTLAARRAGLRGWVAGTFDPALLLAADTRGRTGLRVEILHRNGDEPTMLLAESGTAPARAWTHETEVNAEGPWTVRVSAPSSGPGVPAGTQFAIVLAIGVLLSMLLFGFVEVLARGRVRALRLVARRTRQLRHQATHDALTGLPNRAYTLDRIDHALAVARRGTDRGNDAIALMFLDLDGFKAINDTHGHFTGDELLRAVSARLVDALRAEDLVGRLGGDEFVIVLEGTSLDDGPEVVAERLRAVVAVPLTLRTGNGPVTVQVKASIGIALGYRDDAAALLRDADSALYEAKGQGKDRWAVFEPSAEHQL